MSVTSKVNHLFFGPTQEPMLNTANTGKTQEVLEKMQVNGPGGYKLARKKSLSAGKACMAMTYSRL